MEHRILIISHAHPAFSKGGAEIAAYNLHKAFLARPDCTSLFLARRGYEIPGHIGTPLSVFAPHEMLYLSQNDFFNFSNQNLTIAAARFKDLLLDYQPTVVHFHHYIHLGVEHLRIVRETLPNARIILTLHEYLAICDQNGQMVTTNEHKLCSEATPLRCGHCRSRSPADMFFRERFIKSHFAVVDRFISPSQFLIDRYISWGLSANKITLLENGLPDELLDNDNDEDLPADFKPLHFAYFGQLTQFKGIDILLEAVTLLPKPIKKQIRVEIHGANLEIQPTEFQEKVYKLLEKNSENVSYFGGYEAQDVASLMRSVDWIIVPSIWWENSPLVIQEAFAARRPLIVSNIGGMAEKVKDGVHGYHFRNRNAADLARVIEKSLDTKRYLQFKNQLPTPTTATESAKAHLEVYYLE